MSRFVVNSAAGLKFSFLWWLFTVPACLLFLAPNYSIGSTFTVQDIIDGIAVRRSKVSDVEFQYLITQQNHDAFYTERLKTFERVKPLSDSGIDHLIEIELNAPPRVSSNAFHLLASGNKRAFEIFDLKEGVRVLDVKAVYDGQNLKLLNVQEKNGVVQRLSPKEVISFPTLPKLLGLENQDIADYLQKPEIEAYIKNERMEDGDFIVELLLRRRYILSPELPLEINTEYQVKINAQKDFWPTKIEKYREIVNTTTKQKIRYIEETISATDFVETGGVCFPTRIEESKFHSDTKLKEGSLTLQMSDSSELVSTRSVVMEKIQANTGLSDDLFEFEFPEGTGFYDENIGMGMIVGEPIELMVKHMIESADGLSVSMYTKEEAIAILKKRREGKWEEADALREKILQRKGNQSSVNNTVTNLKAEHKRESTIQVPVRVIEVKSNEWIRPIIYIGLLIGCVCAGYFITKTLKKHVTRQ